MLVGSVNPVLELSWTATPRVFILIMESGSSPAKNRKEGGLRWSVGTDRLKIEKKLTFEFVVSESQPHQIPKLSKGFGDAPYETDQKVGKKSWSVGCDRRQK